MAASRDLGLLRELWRELGGTPDAADAVTISGPEQVLPSVFAVTSLAAGAVALATLAASALRAERRGEAPAPVRVQRAHAALAFRRELLAQPDGWQLPPLWDPIAGDYAAGDGWIRLHTNYAHHRDAVLGVLGVAPTRDDVALAVARWRIDDLEQAVVSAGGCAAAMHDLASWWAHPQGVAVSAEPVLALTPSRAAVPPLPRDDLPLGGVRVLDLTRVIAGPVCTGFLASWGADVLRIDPPGFAEVPGLLPETTAGKRRCALDLGDDDGRACFLELVRDCDVIVVGYRGGALARLGLDEEALRDVNPGLVVAALDAYGWSGPWATRRGFDSLVQMSTGIAARGQEVARSARPFPLPAQALDHATGFLLAAGVCRALATRHQGHTWSVRASLARTARLLVGLGEDGDPLAPQPSANDVAPWLEQVSTAWGPLKRVRAPGEIAGVVARSGPQAGPLGSDPAHW